MRVPKSRKSFYPKTQLHDKGTVFSFLNYLFKFPKALLPSRDSIKQYIKLFQYNSALSQVALLLLDIQSSSCRLNCGS